MITLSEALKEKGTDQNVVSEFDFIRRLRLQSERDYDRLSPPELTCGIGDDAAVIRQVGGKESVITADLLVENVDFRLETTSPSLLAHKALAVSLSDIAAMGARPRWALLSVGVTREVWNSSFLDEFYQGFFSLANRYHVKLIGGDISRVPEKVVIDSILVGECLTGKAILRRAARQGDQIFVTGSLGGAAAGLKLLDNGARLGKNNTAQEESQAIDLLLLRHLQPQPRVGWGIILGQERLATAMIDLSDGLSSDLNHLCRESGVGALIESANLPVAPAVTALSGRRALDPLLLALHGGEDFELLFTVAPENVKRLPSSVDGVAIKRVGEVRPADEGIRIRERSFLWNLDPEGWKHFG